MLNFTEAIGVICLDVYRFKNILFCLYLVLSPDPAGDDTATAQGKRQLKLFGPFQLNFASAMVAQAQTSQLLRRTRMCRYGAGCRDLGVCSFAHSPAELQAAPVLQKTQLCTKFKRHGQCPRGENCQFAHGPSELRKVSNAGRGRGPREPRLPPATVPSPAQTPQSSRMGSKEAGEPDREVWQVVRIKNTFIELTEEPSARSRARRCSEPTLW